MFTACFHALICEFIIYSVDTGPEKVRSIDKSAVFRSTRCKQPSIREGRMTSSILQIHVLNKIKTGRQW